MNNHWLSEWMNSHPQATLEVWTINLLKATNLWIEPYESWGPQELGTRACGVVCKRIFSGLSPYPFLCSLFPWGVSVLPGPLPRGSLFLHLHHPPITGHFCFVSIPYHRPRPSSSLAASLALTIHGSQAPDLMAFLPPKYFPIKVFRNCYS